MASRPFISGIGTTTWRSKRPGRSKGRVKNIRAVGGGDEDDALVGLKAVHFHQKLIEGLFPLVVTAAQAGAAVAADGVDFIDEDDAGSIFLAPARTGRAPAQRPRRRTSPQSRSR